MPEAVAERIPTPEQTKPSPGLMLHIAHGEFDFDINKTDNLNKNPQTISSASYAALEAQNKHIRQQQEKNAHEQIKRVFPDIPEDKMTPEFLRHKHMESWAMNARNLVAITVHTMPQGQAIEVFGKLGITISLKPEENGGLPDQFYKSTTATGGTPGEFYKRFCSGTDMNQQLLNALEEKDIVALKIFLTATLGSADAYSALLATKQTQEALKANQDFSGGNLSLTDTDKSVLGFFQKGEMLLRGTIDDDKEKAA